MASLPTASGKSRKSVHFNDDSNIRSFSTTHQHSRSPSIASDDTNETIRPNGPPPYTQDRPPYSLSNNDNFNFSQSTLFDAGDAIMMGTSSSSNTPLLGQQSSSSPSSVDEIRSQASQRAQSVGYGTMTAPSARRRMSQQTRYTPPRDASERLEAQPYAQGQWQSLWRWLRGANTHMQPTNEEGQDRADTDGFSSISRSRRIIKYLQRLGSKIHGLCDPAERSTTAEIRIRTALSLFFMLTLVMVVFAIAYGVHTLASLGRKDR